MTVTLSSIALTCTTVYRNFTEFPDADNYFKVREIPHAENERFSEILLLAIQVVRHFTDLFIFQFIYIYC